MNRYFSILISLMITNLVFGQSEFGIYSGYFSPKFFDNSNTPHFSVAYQNYNTAIFGIDFINRKDRLINFSYNMAYVSKSFNINGTYGGLGAWENIDSRIDLGILTFNLSPEISFGKKNRFFIQAGPYLGIIVKSFKNGIVKGYNVLGTDNTVDNSKSAWRYFNGNDFGLKFGAGYIYNINEKFGISIMANYGYAFSNLSSILDSNVGILNANSFSFIGGLKYRILDISNK